MKRSAFVLQRRITPFVLAITMVHPLARAASPGMQTALEPPQTLSTQKRAQSNPGVVPAAEPPQAASPQQPGTSKPLGAAAAPEIKTEGTTASTASGAVISSAKQNRLHIFTLKTALIVGAIVAVGIVVGASASSPSHP